MKRFSQLFGLFLLSVTLGGWPLCARSENQPQGADSAAMALQQAVKNRDAHYVSEHIAYPIYLYVVGGKMQIGGTLTAEDIYADWMTPYLYNLITTTPPAKLAKLLAIKKDKNGSYKVHRLLFTGDPADFRYSSDGIYSAKQLMHVLAALRKGATEHCAECVAKVIEYPIWDCIGGKLIKINNEAEFIKHYDDIVTPYLRDLMLHAWGQHNWTGFEDKGIMLGPNGDIWIGSLGHKDAQGFYVWETKVLALRDLDAWDCPAESTTTSSAAAAASGG